MELENVCKELDELALRFFQVLDELSERKRLLESFMKEGFMNLSKARYSMGTRAVSTLQYDSTMKALANVDIRDEDKSSTFQLNRHKPNPRKVTHDSQAAQQDSPKETKVRRRKGKVDETNEPNVENIEAKKEGIRADGDGGDGDDDDRPQVDPLHWFGILVPTALKQGQTKFIQAVDETSRIASLQNQLMSLQDQYKSLYKTKKQLQSKHDVEQCNGQVETLDINGECNSDKAECDQ